MEKQDETLRFFAYNAESISSVNSFPILFKHRCIT